MTVEMHAKLTNKEALVAASSLTLLRVIINNILFIMINHALSVNLEAPPHLKANLGRE